METATVESHALSADETQRIVDEFHREGSVLVPGVLAEDECRTLRERADELYAVADESQIFANTIALREVAAKDALFRDLLVREPILSLARAILGDDCKYCGSNMLRNGFDKAISYWHVDNNVEFPLPPDVPRHDPRIQVPVLWMTFQVALTDIDTEENGPTQFVPTSHYSGRLPNDPDHPEFEGHGPVSLLCKAGDMYLTNHQTWHRGAPNRSSRTRYVLQLQYAMGWPMMRFNNSDTRALVEDLHADGTSVEVRERLRPLMQTAWPA